MSKISIITPRNLPLASSVKWMNRRPSDEHDMLLLYIKNSYDPKFDTCGTPKIQIFESEVTPVPQETYWNLLLKQDVNQWCMRPRTLMWRKIKEHRSHVLLPSLSRQLYACSVNWWPASAVNLPALNTNWCEQSILFNDKKNLILMTLTFQTSLPGLAELEWDGN